MANTDEVKVVVDQAALRAQVETVTNQVKVEAAEQLIAAAALLNPNWMTQRDEQVAAKAVADYIASQPSVPDQG